MTHKSDLNPTDLIPSSRRNPQPKRLLSRFLLLGWFCFGAAGCNTAEDPADRELELKYLRVLMPDDLHPHAHIEVPGVENIAILEDGADQFLGLRLYPGQRQRNGGNRAEVSVDIPMREGDTARYEWRFRIPDDFKLDPPANRWWIIGQWHDQPDPDRGESWDDFPARSPPVLIGIGELEGRAAIALEYGPTQADKHGPLFIERGKWHRLAAVIHWSRQADGWAEFSLDDMNQVVHTFRGPNMHNAFRHYLKLGMYRNPEIATDCWIHLDDLQVTVMSEQNPRPGE